ncbi:MAG: NADH-quinone oxidoreductase subunit NuoG [Gammaproteobacteria bacterium]|nr:NADH-quinone oxidoreductase subunit NuoG [Gammaproteobacteria bacterium]
MVKIEINGIPVEARDGATVIEAADNAGIVIPRFCYHKKLSIAASCRMCLVEVEKAAKPLPACATPVTEGMKVFTRSPKAIAAQKAVMEFLLINHPLDCPICDQGGECDLQEMAMGYGNDVSRYAEHKRIVQDSNLGPLIATDMTRCIHCTRCVRFGQEIAGIMELGAVSRGEHMRITTYIERSVDSELSGNVIDLCPVGALTSKPYRYTARPWELTTSESVSPHDSVGANLHVDTRAGRVMRVRPRANEAVNESWLADRDRFSYTALNHPDRLLAPRVKREGRWEETDWDTALTFAAEGLQRVVDQHGADRVAGLGAYTATTEELYLLQRVLRGLGSGNVDYRLRQQDFRDQDLTPPAPGLGMAIEDLERVDALLLVGSNIRKDQPLLGLRVRKAALAGARVMCVNPVDYEFLFPVTEKIVVAPSAMATELAAVAKALVEAGGKAPKGFAELSAGIAVEERHRAIARKLGDSQRAAVLLGDGASLHPVQSELRALAALIARLSGARFGQIPEGGNAAGAALAGALPHRQAGGKTAGVRGRDWRAMVEAGMKGFVLLGVEPGADALDGTRLQRAVADADFTVALTSFADAAAENYADVMLPICTFAETSGSFVNAQGQWQSFSAAAPAPGQARPAWKVLRVLGNLLNLTDFEYMSSDEVRDEVQLACNESSAVELGWPSPEAISAPLTGLERIAEFPMYDIDPLVRRAEPLQATRDGRSVAVCVHPDTAARLGLASDRPVQVRAGSYEATLPLTVDPAVPVDAVLVPAGRRGMSVDAGAAIAAVELRQG